MRNARLRASWAIPLGAGALACAAAAIGARATPSLGGTWRGSVDRGAKGSLFSA